MDNNYKTSFWKSQHFFLKKRTYTHARTSPRSSPCSFVFAFQWPPPSPPQQMYFLTDPLLLSTADKVSTNEVQKNYLAWYCKMIQTMKKNWLFIWKMTWGIWWTLTWTVESLKICILMDYFCRKYAMFELKRCRGVVLWKMTNGFKNDISNLVNFHTSSWK